jgi:hypothetical protein
MDVSSLRDSHAHIITNQKHMAGDLQDIKTIIVNLLSRYLPS